MSRLRFHPVSRRWFLALGVAYLALRLYLALLPGYVNDVQSYKGWALGAAIHGLDSAYETTGIDYPPLYLYVLWTVGKVYLAFVPEVAPGAVPDSAGLTFLVKLPPLVFDLLLALLLYRLVTIGRTWGAGLDGSGWGRLAALLYLWSPGVLFNSGYWGQPDAIHSALALGSLYAVGAGVASASGGLLGAAGMMKPLAAPVAPVVALALGAREGLRALTLAILSGLAVVTLLFLPFFLTGRGPSVVVEVFFSVEAMPYTSVNGHNLWWILGAWRDANAPLLGALTPKGVGLGLFAIALLTLLARRLRWFRDRSVSRESYRRGLLLVAAASTIAFFFLSTHMHENHLFLAFPLLLAISGRSRGLAWLALGCGLGSFFNLALHDPELPYALPGPLAAPSPIQDPHMQRAYTWVQLVGSYMNALLIGTVTVGTYVLAWRRPAATADEPPRR